MTPEKKADELKIQYGDRALEVCETLFGALTWNYADNHMSLAKEGIVSFWWEVLLALGYDC